MSRVWNIRQVTPMYAILVDRTTPFGNPFSLRREEDRALCVQAHREWLMQPEQRELRRLMRQCLTGADLVCHCTPRSCHADNIIDYLEGEIIMQNWKVVRLPKNRLGIQCPRKDCQCKAVVSKSWLKNRQYEKNSGEKHTIIGRSCTYCFRSSLIPEELRQHG